MATDLPRAIRDDWRRVGDRTSERRIALVSVTAETTVYEHAPTADALATLRDGGQIPVRSLFTVETTFSPSLSAVGLSPAGAMETAAPKAKAQFVETLEDDGIAVGDERFDEPVERPDGTVARLSVRGATYPIDPAVGAAAASDAAADEGTGDPTDGGRSIDAEAYVAVWPTADAYAMAGGLLPLEAPAGVDLDVDPERDRTTVLDFVRHVSLERTA